MSDEQDNPPERMDARAPIPFAPPRRRWRRGAGGPPAKPRVRKLRLLSVLVGLCALAAISTVFGMMMAVASDLPQLENRQQYKAEKNSYLYDDKWRPIGIFAPPNHVVIDTPSQVSKSMKHAIVAVEDKRFWTDPGVDIRGIGRALVADVSGGATQGASTIAQQFVKNALAQQNNRTVLEKLREAALAYHLTREWSKEKILNEYLNSIYFGNGAYGVESAARVYFGRVHGLDQAAVTTGATTGCGDSIPGHPVPSCASVLAPWEAALLAGMVANPSAFDPIAHPQAATARRKLVLADMLAQKYITRQEYDQGINERLPTAKDIEQPAEPPAAPYFTSWLRPQILSAMGLGHGVPARVAEYRAYYGGLKIRTSVDLPMQRAAEQAIAAALPSGPGEPAASLVTIDNRTGEVRAMVGGPLVGGHEDFQQYPFNLATQGHRQPGSAFKPFTLAVALRSGQFSPDSVINSHPLDLIVPNSGGKEHFIVHNFGNTYSGPITLAAATDISDNTVFTQVGVQAGTRNVSRMARAMGIRSPVSSNYAMILGGLKEGVTPLDMAHAYETLAEGGRRVFDPTLGAPQRGPTGIAQIQCTVVTCHGKGNLSDHPRYKRVIPLSVAQTIHVLLNGVVQHGTGQSAAISGVDVAGKTGTTTNYGDAWFVGWTPQLTTAVWVGFPDKLVPMTTLYNGGPVEGGTFPAVIWHDFMSQALPIFASEQVKPKSAPSATGTGTSAGTGTSGGGYGGGGTGTQAAPAPSSGTATATATGTGTSPSVAPTGGTTGNPTGAAGGGGNGAGTGGGTGGASTGGSGGAGLGGG
jgi:penicillin-binding protein 1A